MAFQNAWVIRARETVVKELDDHQLQRERCSLERCEDSYTRVTTVDLTSRVSFGKCLK